jgi:hypothetical protein
VHYHKRFLTTAAFVLGLSLGLIITHLRPAASHAADHDPQAGLIADVARLKAIANDQSHAMSDVAYHYTNLWFAGQALNWPLAQFYFDETRSHLRWAVRIIPTRKDSQGREVDLNGILTALEQSSLKDLDQSIKSADKTKFSAAYKTQLENCMACHRAASKEYIRLHLPDRPEAQIVEFEPPPPAGH